MKERPNHRQYLEILLRMSPEQKLNKVFELNEMGRELFLAGLRHRFPELSEDDIKKFYLERRKKCYNRNY